MARSKARKHAKPPANAPQAPTSGPTPGQVRWLILASLALLAWIGFLVVMAVRY